ncbi:MAG: hypothetical protein ACREUO_08975 [Burkholderiales bacterium]
MGQSARWIRLGLVEPLELQAAYAGLASVQAPRAAPLVLWAQARSSFMSGLVRAEESHYVFALIVPKRLAPGRAARWRAWALAPVVATYRHFGLRAYLNGDDVCLNGRKIAASGAATIGACAVVASSLLTRFPVKRLAEGAAGSSAEFRSWLRDGLALAMTEWAGHAESLAERAIEAVFRARIEAQHGWQFENSWPSRPEQVAVDAARAELAEPLAVMD